jgi:hypothetical protein
LIKDVYHTVWLDIRCNPNFLELLCIVCLVFILFSFAQQNTKGWTYTTIWWLGYSPTSPPDQSPANLRFYYTYPDSVYTDQKFNVGITIEYIKDSNAKLNWINLSNVSVGIRTYFSNYEKDVSTRLIDNGSTLIKPGEYYHKYFTLTAPTAQGKYVVFPAWNAFYGPGTTAANDFRWDLGFYYNNTERNAGAISPEDYPPISVIDKSQLKKATSLKVEIDPPYGIINNKTDIKVIETKNKVPITYPNCSGTQGGKVCKLTINSAYTVEVNKTIDLSPNNIRAVFVTWTDGVTSNTRNITLSHDENLYALYKTQYHLTVGSAMKGNNTYGTDWYFAGSEAPFSVNSYAGSSSLSSFDHWAGDVPSGEATALSGSLTMDDPKEIVAIWRPDYGIIGTIIGLVSGTFAVLGKFRIKFILQFVGIFRSIVRSKK